MSVESNFSGCYKRASTKDFQKAMETEGQSNAIQPMSLAESEDNKNQGLAMKDATLSSPPLVTPVSTTSLATGLFETPERMVQTEEDSDSVDVEEEVIEEEEEVDVGDYFEEVEVEEVSEHIEDDEELVEEVSARDEEVSAHVEHEELVEEVSVHAEDEELLEEISAHLQGEELVEEVVDEDSDQLQSGNPDNGNEKVEAIQEDPCEDFEEEHVDQYSTLAEVEEEELVEEEDVLVENDKIENTQEDKSGIPVKGNVAVVNADGDMEEGDDIAEETVLYENEEEVAGVEKQCYEENRANAQSEEQIVSQVYTNDLTTDGPRDGDSNEAGLDVKIPRDELSSAAEGVQTTATTEKRVIGVRAPPPPVIVSSLYEDDDPTDELGGNSRMHESATEAFRPTLSTIPAGESGDEDDRRSANASERLVRPSSSYSMPIEDAISGDEYESFVPQPDDSNEFDLSAENDSSEGKMMGDMSTGEIVEDVEDSELVEEYEQSEEAIPDDDDGSEEEIPDEDDNNEEEIPDEDDDNEEEVVTDYESHEEITDVEESEGEMEVEYVEESDSNVEVESIANSDVIAKGTFAEGPNDIEMGATEETAPGNIDKTQTAPVVDEDDTSVTGGVFSSRCARCVCFVVTLLIIIGIVLAIELTRNKESSREIDGQPGDSTLPTPSPTTAPTPFNIGQMLVSNFTGPSDSRYGTSISVSRASRSFIVVGAPDAPGPGSVVVLQNTTGEWTATQAVSNGQEGANFGASVSLTRDSQSAGMAIGAPNVFAADTTIDAGAAFYYEYDRAEERWSQLGSEMQGGIRPENANEEFGASVALSDTYRIAIGAPGNNDGGRAAGRVYTFEFRQADSIFEWIPMSEQKLVGTIANSRFGSSVAMSPDGNLLAAGSSLSSLFIVYEWTGSEWKMIFSEASPGGNANEEFGASITFLSNTHVAVGGPGAFNEAGVIRVYGLQENNLFQQVGEDIAGGNGERIGELHTLSGILRDDGQPAFAVGTNTGKVRRFDYKASNADWIERYEAVETEAGPTTAVGMVADGAASTIVAGAEGTSEVFVYEAFFGQTASPIDPTPSTPTVAPIIASATGLPVSETTPNPSAGIPNVSPPQAAPTLAPAVANALTSTPVGPEIETSTPSVGIPTKSWRLVSSLPVGGAGVDTGAAVSITENSVVFTAPGFGGGSGIVQPYERSENTFSILRTVFGEQGSSARFGTAVDAISTPGRTGFLAGAPLTMDTQGFGVRIGAVAYYELSAGDYVQVGDLIEPDATPGAVNGRFGESVAAAKNVARVAVGAPRTSADAATIENGSVHTYEFDGTRWVMLQSSPLLGVDSNSNFGNDVDISQDGNHLVVGAPGANGSASLYDYSEAEGGWREAFVMNGNPGEALGTATSFLTEDANTIAVGGPGYDGGRGVIRVYQRQTGTSSFSQLGQDIIGEVGERLGSRNLLSGSQNRLVLGTATGKLVALDYNEAVGSWEQLGAGQDVGGLTALDTTDNASVAIVGDTARSSVNIFALEA